MTNNDGKSGSLCRVPLLRALSPRTYYCNSFVANQSGRHKKSIQTNNNRHEAISLLPPWELNWVPKMGRPTDIPRIGLYDYPRQQNCNRFAAQCKWGTKNELVSSNKAVAFLLFLMHILSRKTSWAIEPYTAVTQTGSGGQLVLKGHLHKIIFSYHRHRISFRQAHHVAKHRHYIWYWDDFNIKAAHAAFTEPKSCKLPIMSFHLVTFSRKNWLCSDIPNAEALVKLHRSHVQMLRPWQASQ